jgi:Holliday junction resolvasome RuvABC ATP-dependent DNA helicase subunit
MQHLVAAAIKKPQELLPFLTGATDGSILVIEELDGFSRASSEFLIPALEGNRVHIDLGEGSNTRSIPMSLKRFVAVATTSKFSRVDKKLLRWFAVKDFVPYSDDEVSHWIRMLTTSAGLQIPADGLELMVSACQESLSEASTLVKKISEYFRQTKDGISLSRDAILQALSWLGYDHTQTNSLRLLAKLGSMSWGRFRRIRSAVISP